MKEVETKNNNDYRKTNNILKIVVVILILIMGLSFIYIYLLLNKQIKCKDDNSQNGNNYNQNEDIKGFGSRFDEFTIEKDESLRVKINGIYITIENREDGVYLNNHKTNVNYTSGGFILDQFLVLYTSGSKGNLVFFNYNYEEVPFEKNEWKYSDLSLENDKIIATATQYDSINSCTIIENIKICPCKDGEVPNMLDKKDEINGYKDEMISSDVTLIYDGKKIITEVKNEKTVGDYYQNDLNGETKEYCVEIY